MRYETRFKTMLLLVAMTLFTVTATAKSVKVPKMYMFGFAASFSDSIVHFTDIQAVDSVWIDAKTKFLLARDSYSYQLRDFLAKQNMAHRTCVVLYNTDRAKLEKQYQKMKKMYGPAKDGQTHYDLRQLDTSDFRFHAIDMSVEEESVKP